MIDLESLKKTHSLKVIEYLIYFTPFAIIIGNMAINFLNIIIFINFNIILIQNKNIINYYKKYILFFLLISFFLIVNILNSMDQSRSLISYIGLIGHYVFMMSIILCLEINPNFKKRFLKIIFCVIIFVLIDTLYQYSIGYDIFGYEIDDGHGKRLSGPFGDEYVVGSFLSKLFFFSIIFITNKKLRLLKLLLILIFLITIIFTNERSATIMFFLSILIYFILNVDFSIKEKILKFISLFLILFALFSFNDQLKKHFFEKTFNQIGISENNSTNNIFWDSQWGAHYLTSIEIFKDYPILGSGLKTFRVVCSDPKYKTISSNKSDGRCNTHPHNIYLEVLSELGFVGFSIFLSVIIYITYKFIVLFFKYKKINSTNLSLLITFFILFNPLQTTGAFFSTWNGIFYWILLPFILLIFKKPILK